jgi:hypothetical protein
MKRNLERVVVAAVLACSTGLASAWSNHTLSAWPALAAMPEIQAAPAIRVETLETFLAAEARGLEQLLQREEAWARAQVPLYPARPDALVFRAGGMPAELRQHFVAALRINPGMKLNLFVQAQPGVSVSGQATLPWTEVTTRRRASTAQESVFLQLREGDPVAVLDVVATATDEPDYGMDIGLWEDNGTAYGTAYGFGKQPFGNPALEFASQAPFHMGFFHESEIVYKAAGFLRRTYPEYRIHLWQSLAAYALQTGHPYWGWRFAGWALHYIEDLTQPYHATVLPGVGVPRLLWINTFDLLGLHAPKMQAITLVCNDACRQRHFDRRRAGGFCRQHRARGDQQGSQCARGRHRQGAGTEPAWQVRFRPRLCPGRDRAGAGFVRGPEPVAAARAGRDDRHGRRLDPEFRRAYTRFRTFAAAAAAGPINQRWAGVSGARRDVSAVRS